MEIPLNSGAYSAQNLIANAQRCVNLYPEANPQETKAPTSVTHYPRPGLPFLSASPSPAPGRCLYRSNRGCFDPNGDLFAVVGQSVYVIDPDWRWTLLGSLVTPAPTPCSMADNGTDILLVDNSPQGYQIAIPAPATATSPAGQYFPAGDPQASMTQLGDPNFYGSTLVDFLYGFLILNKPGSNIWYCSEVDQIEPFNPLFVGQKTAWADNIAAVLSIEAGVLVLGPLKSEPWFNAGSVPFPFQVVPQTIIEQGIVAPYSLKKMDTFAYWLSESPEGDRMVMRCGSPNVAQRISNHGVEQELKNYARVSDAIGAVYQINGHSFYKLHFPTADKTWGYDAATQQWHEDNWVDSNGMLHRARNTFCAFAYGKNVALDWSNGNLYQIDQNSYADNNGPIVYFRSFPHSLNEMKRVVYTSFTADMATGELPGSFDIKQLLRPWSAGWSSGFGPLAQGANTQKIYEPTVNFRMSKDGGHTWTNWRPLAAVSAGKYRNLLRWPGLGYARDAVFELGWSAPMPTALQAAYVDVIPGAR